MTNRKRDMIHCVRPSATLTSGWRRGIGFVCVVLAASASSAQDEQPLPLAVTFKTLVNFDGTNGGNPLAFGPNLVQGADGNLYGTTAYEGAFGSGSSGGNVFKMTPGGTLSVIYNFCAKPNCADGSFPEGLTLGTDGNIYGTTNSGGPNAGGVAGTTFKITPGGNFTTLYNFCAKPNCADGGGPNGLTLGANGNFYGTTNSGGPNNPAFSPQITSGSMVLSKLSPEWITSGGMFQARYSHKQRSL